MKLGALLKIGVSGKEDKSIAWKGGVRISKKGYILIHNLNHPNRTRNNYVCQHRLVMEEKIGRYLTKYEDVHHINGDKQDNRIENLQLLTRSEHLSLENKGEKNNFFGKTHTDESRSKIKEARKRQVGEHHPMWGKHHSEDTKLKISETKRRQSNG